MNKRDQHNHGAESRFGKREAHTGKIQPGVGFPGRNSKGGGVINVLKPENYVRIDGRIVYRELLSDTAPYQQVAELFDKNRKYLGIGTQLFPEEWYDEDSNLILGVHYYAPC